MKKRFALSAASAAAALAVLGGTATVAYGAETAPRAAGTKAVNCSAQYPLGHATTNVKIRKKASVKSTALRLWYKNTEGCQSAGYVDGGVYFDTCGESDHTWRKVKYRGTWGYVPSSCLRPGKS
ncbi:hypothetical protein ABZY93_25730 [Streptomyces smyrnaeus]|uniref:hypothetical protein n=1 Tax=Streptomyces smyrnaeus TaxID=1387713 RepID=UPI0033B0BB51